MEWEYMYSIYHYVNCINVLTCCFYCEMIFLCIIKHCVHHFRVGMSSVACMLVRTNAKHALKTIYPDLIIINFFEVVLLKLMTV